MTDIRQHKKYANYLKSLNWIVEEKDGVQYFIKKLFFLSMIKVQRPKKISYEEIKKLSKKHRAFQVIIEPNSFKEADSLVDNGWQVGFPFIPSKTVFVDLKKSEKKILDNFSKDTRYSIRKSEHVKVFEEADLGKFRNLWKKSVNIKRHVLKQKEINALRKSFGKDSLFLTAEDPSSAEAGGISGAIFMVAGDVGYYWYGFVGKEGRKKLSQYKVLWEGIKWAKSRGAKTFDMEGIFDERFPIPAWRGFTKFKKGFGGKVVKYPGAYQKTLLPFK
jgi:lipid II:glycine glycyltransferase (peptidoglycan interpeptide bridge formation enzyme)